MEMPANSTTIPNISIAQTSVLEFFFDYCMDRPAGSIFGVIVELITFILGLPANMMVLWILLRNKSHLSPFEVFVFSLCVLDMLFCIAVPVGIINFFILKSINMIKIISFFFGFCFFGGPLFLACLCVDRYIAVLHPITYITFKGPKYRMACSAVVWIITLTLCTLQSCSLFRFDEIELIAAFYIVVPVMVFCNISILRALRQSGPGSEGIHPMKKKAFKTVLVILLIMLVNYLPSIATFTFKQYMVKTVHICSIVPSVICLACLSSCIQPIFYLYSVGKLPCMQNTMHTP